MRRVARSTAFRLDRSVFVSERPLLICVALETRRIRACGKASLLLLEAAVRIVAIRAPHGAFQNFVVERLVELMLRFAVAVQAQLRL